MLKRRVRTASEASKPKPERSKTFQNRARKRACEPRGRLEAPTGAQEASRRRPGAAREEPRDAQEPPKAGQVASKIQFLGDSREFMIPFLVSYTICSTSWPWCAIRTLFTAFRGLDARSVHYLQHFGRSKATNNLFLDGIRGPRSLLRKELDMSCNLSKPIHSSLIKFKHLELGFNTRWG